MSEKIIFHPWEFEEIKTKKEIYKKFSSYGIGQGALFKKYYNPEEIVKTMHDVVNLAKKIK